MTKSRRHATRIATTGSPTGNRVSMILTQGGQKLRNFLQSHRARTAVLPGSLLLAAVSLLTIGFSSPDSSRADTPSSFIADVSAETPPALTLASNDTPARMSVAIDLESELNRVLSEAKQAESVAPEPTLHSHALEVASGDSLSTLFKRVGLDAKTLYRFTHSSDAAEALKRVYPGQQLIFELDDAGQLVTLKHIKNRLEETHFIAAADSFTEHHISRQPDVRRVQKRAAVTQSLSAAAHSVGMSSSMTMNMANIFGGVMDFALDVRPSDSFLVIYEELYLDGEKIGDGNILAARYINAGKTFNAFRYEHQDGEIGYYNEDGESMRKVFLRAPLDFTRVSSGFNMRRLHPITKKVKPHRGIDYAAPVGTPIFSVGDGRVAASGYSKANGNYVFIRHGDTYQTKYLHLKKRNVSAGQRIKQGQIIGSVGCTGMCTGPHLHYEFLVNGVHRNPRTIVSKLPKAKRLAKTELARFESSTLAINNLLEHYSNETMLALSD